MIHFSEKHKSLDAAEQKLFRISTTCADQSFYTAFALQDFTVNMYLMNFKKGSSITWPRLLQENERSLRIIKTLPTNLMS